MCSPYCAKEERSRLYDPSSDEENTAWCRICQKWIHNWCAVFEEMDDSRLEEWEQSYIKTSGDSLVERILRLPIRRYSRKNGAPLSLEILQDRLIRDYISGGGCDRNEGYLEEVLENCPLGPMRQAQMKHQAFQIEDIKLTVSTIHFNSWLTCPNCQSQYI